MNLYIKSLSTTDITNIKNNLTDDMFVLFLSDIPNSGYPYLGFVPDTSIDPNELILLNIVASNLGAADTNSHYLAFSSSIHTVDFSGDGTEIFNFQIGWYSMNSNASSASEMFAFMSNDYITVNEPNANQTALNNYYTTYSWLSNFLSATPFSQPTQAEKFLAIANSIRGLGNSTAPIVANDFATTISGMGEEQSNTFGDGLTLTFTPTSGKVLTKATANCPNNGKYKLEQFANNMDSYLTKAVLALSTYIGKIYYYNGTTTEKYTQFRYYRIIQNADESFSYVQMLTPTGELAITENGVVDVSQYATANVNVSGGGGNYTDPIVYRQNHRASDWLPITLPDELPTDEDNVYVLFGVSQGGINVITFDVTGYCTVEWGDLNGSTEQNNSATTMTFTHTYGYDDVDSNSFTEHNQTRQVIIRITSPTRGGITGLNFNKSYTYNINGASGSFASSTSSNIYELSGNCGGVATFGFASSPSNISMGNIEYFSFLGLNVTNMSSMFDSCNSLQAIPLLDTSKVTNMSYMFDSCYSLQAIPLLDTSKVTDMSSMFSSCYSLQAIPLLNTSKVTSMRSMFNYCNSLQAIPLLDTSNVTNMNAMFNYCKSLQAIPLLDTSKVTDMSSMFSACYSLSFVKLENCKISLSISYSNCFTPESLGETIEALGTVTSTKTLTMGTANLAKLTDEQKAIATAKGWTLA